MVPIRDEGK